MRSFPQLRSSRLPSTVSHRQEQAQPVRAGEGRGGTAWYDSRCSASFSHQAYSTAVGSAPAITNFLRYSFSWNKPFLCICRIFSLIPLVYEHLYIYIPFNNNVERNVFLNLLDLKLKLSQLWKRFLLEMQVPVSSQDRT